MTANLGPRLAGKVAIVTGGGGAMGGAQCRLFAEHGAAVCVADFRIEAAEAVRAEIGELGGQGDCASIGCSRRERVGGMCEGDRRRVRACQHLV